MSNDPDYSPIPGLSGNEGMLFGLLRGLRDHLNYQDGQRAKMHEENQRDIREMREAMDSTAQTTRESAKWIAKDGQSLIVRVDALENDRKIRRAEGRGEKRTWTYILSIGSAIGAVLTGVITYGRDVIEFLKGLHHGG